ncbi:YjbH domain-containing protein [Vibrio sp. JPW-9-11-11]|uniref:YjbH domain-containing protein n=1 Tax=Vibrio sp. JPW-9-11-11 TaxID=1416532 RepID=UPI00159335AA|nr:YjbH domain-containing protein [Vibrio sp. JPW-9-11-11]NVD05412.1 YjbH domain-containing protein [Vibrio sp. JPW-9-11-11]
MKPLSSALWLSSSLVFASASTIAKNNAQWEISQTDFGGVGLMQVPTGRVAEHGEFNIGLNFSEDYYHYSVSTQIMPWLETTVRYTQVPDVLYSDREGYSGSTKYTDKGIDVKLRLWDESYWLPETSVGWRDLGGTGLFDSEYVAATKRFGNLDVTLGLGWGYLGLHNDVTNPACKASESYCVRQDGYKGSGGTIDAERWFTGPMAIFGGFEYQTPYEPLRLKLEYEGNDYSTDFPVVRGSKEMNQGTRWNAGVNYRLGDWGDVKVSYQRGELFSVGLNLYTNFNQMTSVWRDEPKEVLTQGQRPAEGDSEAYSGWQTVSSKLQSNAGYAQNHLYLEDDTLVLTGSQIKYRDREEALDRAAVILHNHLTTTEEGHNITSFKVVEQLNGLALTQTEINREDYLFAATYSSIDAKLSDALEMGEPDVSVNGSIASSWKPWDYSLSPVLKQSFGGPESFYLYNFGISAGAHYWFTAKLELSGGIYVNLLDNYDKFNYGTDNHFNPHVDNEATPRVRTMIRSYVHDNPVRMNQLQLTWFEQPAESIYTQAYAGYLEMMFAGVGSEVLYRPMQSNWALGVDLNFVSQRDPDSWFGVYDEDYDYFDGVDSNSSRCVSAPTTCRAYVLNKGFTGHVTAYYTPQWSLLDNTLFKVSAGQFLGGDVGVQGDVAKQFDSGVIMGLYAAFTDLTSEEYGEGSFNKGFYISIPLDLMTVKPSTSRAVLAWEPITRDGGQKLSRKYHLYDRTDARAPWSEKASRVE